jgi:hypothetical protein
MIDSLDNGLNWNQIKTKRKEVAEAETKYVGEGSYEREN